jgi:hypothetical protein
MRDAVGFYNLSIRGFPAITDFTVALSRVLVGYPDVRLVQLAWQASDDPKAAAPLAAAASRFTPSVRSVGKAPEATPVAVENPNAPFSTGRYEVAHLEATVRVPHDDFRTALDLVERLAGDIERLPGFDAEVIESPLDVRSSLALQGRFSGGEPALMEPRFVLRIVRERKKAP